MSKKPDEILFEAAELFKKRNAEYGDAYQSHCELMFQLIGPIKLETLDDFKRLIRISGIVGKLNRYTKNFSKGGHGDSASDLIVYAAMLKELENDRD